MTSSVDSPSWEALFKTARDNTMVMLHTMLPGIVVSYDESTRTAVVQPAIYDGAEAMEPIEDVPVLFPRGGGFRLVFPLVKGDEVEIRFSKVDPARFLVTGEVSKADNVRRGGLYGFAVPASISDSLLAEITSVANALHLGLDDGTTDIVIKDGEVQVLGATLKIGDGSTTTVTVTTGTAEVVANAIKLGAATTADYVALASKVDQMFVTMQTAVIAGLAGIVLPSPANGAAGVTAFNSAYTPVISVASTKVGIDS